MRLSDFENVSAVRQEYFRTADALALVQKYLNGEGNDGEVEVTIGSCRLSCLEFSEPIAPEAWAVCERKILEAMKIYLDLASTKLATELRDFGVIVDEK